MNSADVLIGIRDLKVDFRLDRTTVTQAVKGISFDIPANSTVALVGESGSGKSVTALAILGLLPKENATVPPGSQILYGGRNLLALTSGELQKLRGADTSMIFQEPMSSLNPVFTVGFQLTEVLTKHLGMTGGQARARALELLREVGIPEPETKIDAYPFQLSGGQQQRVMIAIAIACEPKLLIADEPTTALDVTIQKQILELIAALQKRLRMSVLFITHDLALVGEIADHVVVMREGEIKEQGRVEQIFEAPQDAYTRALLLCRPQLTRRPRRLPVIDDFLKPGPPAGGALEERSRGLRGDEEIILEVRHLGKSFYSREGFIPQKELMPYKRRIQIVFQNPYASLNPRFTIGQLLMEPLQVHGIGASESERRDTVYRLLEEVGLPEVSFFKYPHEFSGGQRQRIAIARCLTMKPDVLICDEAVSALDVSIQAQVLNLLQDLQDEHHMSYIFISHDLAVVKYMADQVMVMNEGKVVEVANSDDIYRNPQHPYTKKLLSSIPQGWRGARAR
ncbi:MAG: ABC transporter ATP-binding protein [Betaproteobacteria bacterium]|nr:MAG: ABC transporter ATP-binding protein [Betaproteobacteria bacterium]